MNPIRITSANRNFGAPQGWDPARDGECATLPIRDTGELLQSAWQPTAHELAALNAGGSVVLTIWGRAHPVVSLGVEPTQVATTADARSSNQQLAEALARRIFACGDDGPNRRAVRMQYKTGTLRDEHEGGGFVESAFACFLKQLFDELRPAAETTGKRESGWLIEFADRSGYFSPGYRDEYWYWTWGDPNQAIRFARRIDAECLIAHMSKFNTTFFQNARMFASEHVWMDRSPVKTAADEPGAK